jgi:hypothetical protein
MSELSYTPEIKEEPTATGNDVRTKVEENDPLCCSCPPDPDTGIIKCPTDG